MPQIDRKVGRKMILKFAENRVEGCWDGWVIWGNILNVYHHVISKEKYLELCNCEPKSYPFNYTIVKEQAKSVRVIHVTRNNGTTLSLAVSSTTVYLLNENGKTIETII